MRTDWGQNGKGPIQKSIELNDGGDDVWRDVQYLVHAMQSCLMIVVLRLFDFY